MTRKNVSILYAEDDDNDVFLMRRALTQTGVDHTLQVAENGQLALELLNVTLAAASAGEGAADVDIESHGDLPTARSTAAIGALESDPGGPVLVILDLKMPVLAGLEVLEKIRSESAWRKLFVVMFSSSNQERDIAAAHKLKANGYIIKPTNIAGLRTVTKSLLETVASGGKPDGWLAFEGNQPVPA